VGRPVDAGDTPGVGRGGAGAGRSRHGRVPLVILARPRRGQPVGARKQRAPARAVVDPGAVPAGGPARTTHGRAWDGRAVAARDPRIAEGRATGRGPSPEPSPFQRRGPRGGGGSGGCGGGSTAGGA